MRMKGKKGAYARVMGIGLSMVAGLGVICLEARGAQKFMDSSEVSEIMRGIRPQAASAELRGEEPIELPSFRSVLGDREVAKMDAERTKLGRSGDDVDQGEELQKLNIKKAVDLRHRDTPIKKQVGPRCTAWGLVGVMENFLGGVDAANGRTLDLSEKHLWSYYSVYSAAEAIYNATQSKVTEEEYWPSQSNNPIKGYMAAARTELASYRFFGESVRKALEALDRGNPVYVGMRVPSDMGDRLAVIRPDSVATNGGHALGIVGYRLDPAIKGGGYFIMRNSWGAKAGDNGYQYMSFYNCMRSDMYCYFWEIDDVVRLQR